MARDEGEYQETRSKNEEIAHVLGISMRKIDQVKKRFVVDGLDVALNGRKGSRVYKKWWMVNLNPDTRSRRQAYLKRAAQMMNSGDIYLA